jgi:hypothetical protein
MIAGPSCSGSGWFDPFQPTGKDRNPFHRDEGILGHMASKKIHSVEAGLILIADGCDMEKGRARIPLILNTEAKVGDIHKYSSKAIERVTIGKGESHPIKIEVEMSSDVGSSRSRKCCCRRSP